MPDGYEVANSELVEFPGHECLNPGRREANDDADSDGLNNFDEFTFGTDPCSTDGDGLLDGEEVFGFGPFGTDPLDPDTDDDSHLDGFDNCPKFFYEDTGQFGFNPGQANFDGDFLGDVCDPDDDNDGVADADDSCPLTSTEGFDADGDGCHDTLPDSKHTSLD